MGRISDILPSLYYDKQNDLIRFVDCLDLEVKELERKVKGITDLVNIDKCPDDKLPYLAALTNCPLMGNDPAMWRRQIRYWPYILKIKGSPRSLEVFLNSIDVDDYTLHTFFRDDKDNLVEAKPEAPPFRDSSGLWHNIRTHFFDLDIIYQNEHFLTWKEWHDDFLNFMNIWLTRAKPFHSELRYLNVFLRRLGDMSLTVGTATGQAYHHDVALEQKTHSADSQIITAGTGILHRPQHEVSIIWSTHAEDISSIYVAQGLAQGGHHEITTLPPSHSRKIQHVSVAGAVQQKPVHEVNINQAHSANIEAHIASGGIVACGVHTQISMAA